MCARAALAFFPPRIYLLFLFRLECVLYFVRRESKKKSESAYAKKNERRNKSAKSGAHFKGARFRKCFFVVRVVSHNLVYACFLFIINMIFFFADVHDINFSYKQITRLFSVKNIKSNYEMTRRNRSPRTQARFAYAKHKHERHLIETEKLINARISEKSNIYRGANRRKSAHRKLPANIVSNGRRFNYDRV